MAASSRRCVRCGSALRENALTCDNCGAVLGPGATHGAATSGPTRYPTTRPDPSHQQTPDDADTEVLPVVGLRVGRVSPDPERPGDPGSRSRILAVTAAAAALLLVAAGAWAVVARDSSGGGSAAPAPGATPTATGTVPSEPAPAPAPTVTVTRTTTPSPPPVTPTADPVPGGGGPVAAPGEGPEAGARYLRAAGCPRLRSGASGPCVRALQRALNRYGSGLIVDGFFGRGTDEAVRGFQRSRGLEADGVVGPATVEELLR